MAEHGPGSASQDGRDSMPVSRQRGVADGIDAAMQWQQPADPNPIVHLVPLQPEPEQLTARNHPVLAGRNRGDRPIASASYEFA
ncbi:MAG: hypothetical protein U0T02_03090 [Solirubrobacteraceae bacterium]